MSYFELENEKIKIKIASLGAEMKSLAKKETQQEFLWNGDPAYWKRSSPVLFPLVGSLIDNSYRVNGKTYSMSQHGFARDMEFELISQEKDTIWFALKESEETLEKYPFAFELHVGYRLIDSGVKVMWKVFNKKEELLPFAIGGHPAFVCPALRPECQEKYYLKFDSSHIQSRNLEGAFASRDSYTDFEMENGMLEITNELFAGDALVIEHNQAHEVSLCDGKGNPFVTVKMEAPLFGIWSPPGKQAPFVCIEPWYGRCDSVDFSGDITQRQWENLLEKGQCFEAEYEIII